MTKIDQKDIQVLSQKSWTIDLAKRILEAISYTTPDKGYVLFETGYGPSGLPHIGTFGEVKRTVMVMRAFKLLSDIPVKLVCFSDDMDALKKWPDTLPSGDEYKKYKGMPFSSIPDPFRQYSSLADYMNARLRKFLDEFGFDYEFRSASHWYKSGLFNEALIKVLENYQTIMDIMLPTLGEERQQSYSPFLPICSKTGIVLQARVIHTDVINRTITYIDPRNNEEVTTSILNGKCKLQWKPDFGMRWTAFNVDFEMYGKDHLVNGAIYSAICKALGGKPPVQFFFELFLDKNGQKISKSKGNGFTLEEWLRYAPKESLAFFMYNSPQKAKKLSFDIVPKTVDQFIQSLNQYNDSNALIDKASNPIHYIYDGPIPKSKISFSYSLLLNLVSACSTDDINVIRQYVRKYIDDEKLLESDLLNNMLRGIMHYYNDFLSQNKAFKTPNSNERKLINTLLDDLHIIRNNQHEYNEDTIQNTIYNIAKSNNLKVKDWFQLLYEVMLGSKDGPRLGSFIMLYGLDKTIALLEEKLQHTVDTAIN